MALITTQHKIQLEGYEILEKFHKNDNHVFFYAIRQSDQTPVVIKLLDALYPSPIALNRLRQEYTIAQALNHPYILKAHALIPYHNSLCIVLENFNAISLSYLLEHKKLNLSTLLIIAIHITKGLSHIHRKNIIHKDIKPSNILINPNTFETKIADFSISSQVTNEPIDTNLNYEIEGTLAYISPEQTGRMNRNLSYHSDIYSLGVTLYHMFTGQLPFSSTDTLALIHAHIAKSPTPPHEINKSLPKVLSEIILKLMAKTAEDRYQSSLGITADLQKCLYNLNTYGSISYFKIAQNDVSDKLTMSQKLYGRDNEIKLLLSAFKKALNGYKELVLISGYAGMGKSVLVHEIQKSIINKRAYFIEGNFEQMQQHHPYLTIIAAFKSIIKQILTESEQQIAQWRTHFLLALGDKAAIITDAIPDLALIINQNSLNKTSTDTLQSTNEKEQYFAATFEKFISVFATKKHPLVIFLDNLQWADEASLKLVESLLRNNGANNLLVIGAYRDNEISGDHPLVHTIQNILNDNIPTKSIELFPLNLENIIDLITDTFACLPEKATLLAVSCLNKTEGNPFFINKFLTSLYQQKIITFDFDNKAWDWDLTKVNKANFTNNVVNLMTTKIQNLPSPNRHVLQMAACIGKKFDLATLNHICKTPPNQTSDLLWHSFKEGLVIPLNKTYSFTDTNAIDPKEAIYEFSHDRIQKAAYSLIKESHKKELHYSIGQFLLEQTKPDELDNKLFDIIQHFNIGQHINNKNFILDWFVFAELNFKAAIKTKKSMAYHTTNSYLQHALSVLPDNSWKTHYTFTLNLYNELADLAYIDGQHNLLMQYHSIINENSTVLQDKLFVCNLSIQSNITNNQLHTGIQEGLNLLQQLSVGIPSNPTKVHIFWEYLKTRFLLVGKQTLLSRSYEPTKEHLNKHLPIIHLLATMGIASYSRKPNLVPIIILKMMQYVVKYGTNSLSPFTYACYSMLLQSNFSNNSKALKFSKLALKLLEVQTQNEFTAKTIAIITQFISPWNEPYKKSLNLLKQSIYLSYNQGDLEYALLSTFWYLMRLFNMGTPLKEIQKEIQHIFDTKPRSLKQKSNLSYTTAMYQTFLEKLISPSNQPDILKGSQYNEITFLENHQIAQDNTALFNLYLFKLILAYTFEQYEQAIVYSEQANTYISAVMSSPNLVLLNWYSSLSCIALYPKSNVLQQQAFKKQINKQQQQLKNWAKYAPANFLHRYYLIEAELSNLQSKTTKAIDYYDLAIQKANEMGYIHESALANELATKFYFKYNKNKIARAYLVEAHYLYHKWGATSKLIQLEQKYSQILALSGEKNNLKPSTTTTIELGSSIANTNRIGNLDISTLLKAAQAISSEIMLDKLLAQMMRIVMENAGAEKGMFLLPHKNQKEWYIEVEGKIGDKSHIQLEAEMLKKTDKLSRAIVNYVINTHHNLVLGNAREEGDFIRENYIINNTVKSVLCMPLLNQGKLNGILYLENNLTTNAFSAQRLEVLDMLTAQMAISIENATLYANMTALNKAYERFVPNQFLSFLNKSSITDVQLGDQVEKEMTILFADVRNFTSLSEQMTPQENFQFINALLSRLEPIVTDHNGFIDKYMGDSIMALFPTNADMAVRCAIEMMLTLKTYNEERATENKSSIEIGIGINSGKLMLGTIGGANRMDSTVISDAVNLASRMESATKSYKAALLISEFTYVSLENPALYAIRMIDRVTVKGKGKPITIYEVYDYETLDILALKKKTLTAFEMAILLFKTDQYDKSLGMFKRVLSQNPHDTVSEVYIKKCEAILAQKG